MSVLSMIVKTIITSRCATYVIVVMTIVFVAIVITTSATIAD